MSPPQPRTSANGKKLKPKEKAEERDRARPRRGRVRMRKKGRREQCVWRITQCPKRRSKVTTLLSKSKAKTSLS